MTLVADRPTGARRPGPPATPRTRFATWRLASRLARREVRRRPGRTALVAALVAIPVAGMSGAAIALEALHESPAELFSRTAGAADLLIAVGSSPTNLDHVVAELPDGSTTLTASGAYAPLRTAGDEHRAAWLKLTDLDLRDPLTTGIVEITEGEPPGPGEVLLDETSAAKLGVAVGDDLVLERPEGTWTVSGVGRGDDEYARFAIAPGFDFARIRSNYRNLQVFAALPDDASTAAVVAELRDGTEGRASIMWAEDFDDQNANDAEQLAWGWVIGVLALAVMGIIIAAAFATSARRQLATIGQLSANGASSSVIREMLVLQGSWSGLVGAVTGVGVAAVSLLVARLFVDGLARRTVDSYGTVVWQIAVITGTAVAAASIAALVPARTATGIPVLAALAGRRPVDRPRRRLAPIAAATFIAGVLLLLTAAVAGDGSSNSNASLSAALGGVGVLAGLCAVVPLFVDALRLLPTRSSWRLSTRSLVRQRSRSAAIVTAIATIGSAAMVAGTVATRIADDREALDAVPSLPADTVLAVGSDPTEPWRPAPVAPNIVSGLRRTLPDATFTTWRIPGFEPGPTAGQSGYGPGNLVIADPAVLEVIGLSSRDRTTLEQEGMLAMSTWGYDQIGNRVQFVIPTSDGLVTLDAPLREDPPVSWGGQAQILLTEERLADLGWPAVDGPLLVRTPEPLTSAQRAALEDLQERTAIGDDIFVDPDPRQDEASAVYLQYDEPTFEPTNTQAAAVIVAVALLLTLGVVAIGLSLAATEGRDERDVLVAVGARVSTLRRLSAQRALLMTVLAALLAIPVGYASAAVVIRQVEGDWPTMPWMTAIGLLIVVPALAGSAAWVINTIAQRVRPPRLSTLTFD